MISFDLIYIKPSTVNEAVDAYNLYESKGLTPLYLGGGTEIISFMRDNKIKADALIDLKGIDDLREIKVEDDEIYIGGGVTLNEIIDSNLFPLLSEVSKHIADHTIRNRLTIGGNIAGMLPYREAILPLLTLNSLLIIMGSDGLKKVKINDIFSKRLNITKKEFIVGIKVKKEKTLIPWFFKRKERFNRVDYPIVSFVAVKENGKVNIAVSGAFDYPVKFEDVLSLEDLENFIKVNNLKFKDDQRASSSYREFLFKEIFKEAKDYLGGV